MNFFIQEMHSIWGITDAQLISLDIHQVVTTLRTEALRPNIPRLTKLNLRAALYLLRYKIVELETQEIAGNYLEACYHLTQLKKWEICSQILWLQVGSYKLYQQLKFGGEYSKILEVFELLLPNQDKKWQCFSLHELGYIYAALGEWSKSIQSFKTQISIAEELNLCDALLKGLSGLGWVYSYCQSKIEEANECYQRQFQIAHQTGNLVEEAKSLDGLARVFYLKGHLRRSSKLYQQAWKLLRNTNASVEERLDVLLHLESSYLAWARVDSRIGTLKEIRAMALQLENKYQIWYATHNLGCIYVITKKWGKAEEELNLAIQLAKEMNAPKRIFSSLSTLGANYIRKGDWQKAVDYTYEAARGFQNLGDRESEASCWFNLSYCYSEMGQLGDAIQYANKLYELSAQAGLYWNYGESLLAKAYIEWLSKKPLPALKLSIHGIFILGGMRSEEGRLASFKVLLILWTSLVRKLRANQK